MVWGLVRRMYFEAGVRRCERLVRQMSFWGLVRQIYSEGRDEFIVWQRLFSPRVYDCMLWGRRRVC